MLRRRDTQFPYRPGPFKFRPPLHSPLVMAFATLAAPVFLRSKGVAQVAAAEGVLEQLSGIGHGRVVLTPNHPGYEPVVLFALSRRIRRDFHYLAAKEVFQHSFLQGFVAQRIGAYSIVRGATDRDSIRMTREIIARGQRWLVAFPEGQDHYHGDVLLPFQSGVVSLCLMALEKLKDEHGEDRLPPLLLLPVAVRYHFTEDVSATIESVLREIETRLKLPDSAGLTRYERLLRAGEFVLSRNEREYGIRPPADGTLDSRLAAVREAMIGRVCESLGLKVPSAELPLRDRLRSLFNALEAQPGDSTDNSAYSRELNERRLRQKAELYRELDRVLAFVAASGRYVQERPTQERFMDVLGRFEREVLHKERFHGPKRALVLTGEPIDIAARYSEYLADKRGFAQKVTLELESTVARLLDESANLQRPLGEALFSTDTAPAQVSREGDPAEAASAESTD